MGNLTPPPRGGGGAGVLPDGICNVPQGMVFKQLSLGLDIKIREQLLDRKEFGKFSSVKSSKIQLNQKA